MSVVSVCMQLTMESRAKLLSTFVTDLSAGWLVYANQVWPSINMKVESNLIGKPVRFIVEAKGLKEQAQQGLGGIIIGNNIPKPGLVFGAAGTFDLTTMPQSPELAKMDVKGRICMAISRWEVGTVSVRDIEQWVELASPFRINGTLEPSSRNNRS